MSEQPSLINNDTKVFITNTLKKCHKVKETYYNYMYNINKIYLNSIFIKIPRYFISIIIFM